MSQDADMLHPSLVHAGWSDEAVCAKISKNWSRGYQIEFSSAKYSERSASHIPYPSQSSSSILYPIIILYTIPNNTPLYFYP